jgi:hypothetical protein
MRRITVLRFAALQKRGGFFYGKMLGYAAACAAPEPQSRTITLSDQHHRPRVSGHRPGAFYNSNQNQWFLQQKPFPDKQKKFFHFSVLFVFIRNGV